MTIAKSEKVAKNSLSTDLMGMSCDAVRRGAEKDMRMRVKAGGGWSAVEILYEGAGAPFCFPNCHTNAKKKLYSKNHGSAFPLLGFSGVRRLI
jgi:hypothetical protein